MIHSGRPFSTRLRLWLLAATVALLFTSIIEAGHLHGIFTQQNDHCSLCQFSVALDKTLTRQPLSFIVIAQASLILGIIATVPVYVYSSFTAIRAPPRSLHTR